MGVPGPELSHRQSKGVEMRPIRLFCGNRRRGGTFGLVTGETQAVFLLDKRHEQRQLLGKPQGRQEEIREEIQGLQCTPPAFMCPKNGATKSKRCDSKTKNPREKDEPPQGTSNMQGGKCQKVMPKKPVKGKKRSKIVPGTSGPEQAQRQLRSQAKASISAQQSKKTAGSKRKKVNVWANRLRKRKPVAYEEISDPEEEEDEDD
ncbi:hypothetical protein E5288_WYG001506 [Bos mutus]|uniref:Uncharacterized protein n=1 Tax=Bos mutus TaxID=72004 RepID=A0A6B0S8A0_9CETA|nr:hypothetical protein [Bos mutus]